MLAEARAFEVKLTLINPRLAEEFAGVLGRFIASMQAALFRQAERASDRVIDLKLDRLTATLDRLDAADAAVTEGLERIVSERAKAARPRKGRHR